MRIAVVIPALDEGAAIESAISSVFEGEAPTAGSGAESPTAAPAPVAVIVADGGSRDDTRERARSAGARVVQSERGRAVQLQAALETSEAKQADVVLMLHADTRLAPGWQRAIAAALAAPEVVGGAFRFAFAPDELARASEAERRSLAVVAWGARWRVRWLGLPYGDQGLFARRSALQAIGGVPQVELMEDVDLVRALRTQGQLAALPLPAWTSARRHLARGPMRLAFQHIGAALADKAGVSRDRIARWLRR